MRPAHIPLLLAIAACLMYGCKKSDNSPFAAYASKMSRARHWSGNTSSKYPNMGSTNPDSLYLYTSGIVPDTVIAVQITGSNTIQMMGSTLTYKSRDQFGPCLYFSYIDLYSGDYAELYYFYQADSMTFSSGWSHHQFYNGYFIHTD